MNQGSYPITILLNHYIFIFSMLNSFYLLLGISHLIETPTYRGYLHIQNF